MSQPSARELLKKLQKIEEAEAKKGKEILNEEGPEDNKGFETGKEVGVVSKDDHSSPVKHVRKPGSDGAEDAYTGNEKDMDTKTGTKRDSGAEKAEEEFTGSEKAVSDNFKHDKGGKDKVAAAEGADKEFAEFRKRVRKAMGLSLTDKKNKGNDGSLH